MLADVNGMGWWGRGRRETQLPEIWDCCYPALLYGMHARKLGRSKYAFPGSRGSIRLSLASRNCYFLPADTSIAHLFLVAWIWGQTEVWYCHSDETATIHLLRTRHLEWPTGDTFVPAGLAGVGATAYTVGSMPVGMDPLGPCYEWQWGLCC